jgi:hypothetical protein
MHSGEAEFEEARQCVLRQQDVEVFHFIIDGLPEYEAHNALWKTWNDCKKNFDIFIKVDADTIIDDPKKFSQIADEFNQNSRLTGMQIPLHDYFTDGPILGLNCFSPSVIFTPASSRLHADHADKGGHDIVYRNEKVAHLAPAGRHCAYPNDYQAFHFGLHRMKKNQRDTMRKVYQAWKASGGRARLLALYGAAAAISGFSGDHDYDADSFKAAYNRVEEYGLENEDNLRSVQSLMRALGEFDAVRSS